MTGVNSKQRLRFCPGFTLLELLVVSFIFVIAMGILTQTYIQFTRLIRKTANAAAVQQEMRFTFEYIARAVRNTPIDYVNQSFPTDGQLYLADPDRGSYYIKKTDPGDALCGGDPAVACLVVSRDFGVTWFALTGERVHVDTFRVFVHPESSPFNLIGNAYPSDDQPFVTVHLGLTYISPRETEQYRIEAQTSISSRVYVR